MKTVRELIAHIDVVETKGDLDKEVSSLAMSSRDATHDSLFVALVGNVADGHVYIAHAITQGAIVIVHERELPQYDEVITYVRVKDSHEAIGYIASTFYDHPSRKMTLVGVTGTNGKTTVTTLLHDLFRKRGHNAGLIGTVVNKINDTSIEAVRTTPDPISLNKLLADMVSVECTHCFMEVSSHAISEKRIAGLSFNGGVFTNLTHDHLDYHKTFEAYRDTKKAFFDHLPESAFALVNLDDSNGSHMFSDTRAKRYTYSLKTPADFTERLETKLIGEFNAYNALAIYGTAVLLGEDSVAVVDVMKVLEPVPGRFQYVQNDKGVTAIVDYAHTPDALQNVLRAIHEMKGTGKVITVVGCGGDRDPLKRPIMARIGYDLSDILILTSDNPRSEEPEKIIDDMKKGIQGLLEEKVRVLMDRREAIKEACRVAVSGDYILVAGKGHETYQEIKGEKTHFDDLEEIHHFL